MNTCPKCDQKFNLLDLITQPSMCSKCFKSLTPNYAPPSPEALEERKKPFSVKRLLLSLFFIILALSYILFTIYSNGADFHNWPEGHGRKSPLGIVMMSVMLIIWCLLDICVNLLKLKKQN